MGEDVTKIIERLLSLKITISIIECITPVIGSILIIIFQPYHCICIFIIGLLIMILTESIKANIDSRIESWKELKKRWRL